MGGSSHAEVVEGRQTLGRAEMSFLSLLASYLTRSRYPGGMNPSLSFLEFPPSPFYSWTGGPPCTPLLSRGGLVCKFKAGFCCILSPVYSPQISPG